MHLVIATSRSLNQFPSMRSMPAMLNRRIPTLALVASWTSIASAHPGHGTANPNSPEHYLLSVEHAVPIIAVGLIATMIAVGFAIARTRSRAV